MLMSITKNLVFSYPKIKDGRFTMNSNTFNANSLFHGSWKVTKLLHETEAKVGLW